MKTLLSVAALTVFASAPAYATGGMLCSTAGARPVQLSLTIGHVAGSPLVGARLTDRGQTIPVNSAQWWMDSSELRLLLVDPQARREEARIVARRSGGTYDGSLWRDGQRRWVRCREN